MCSGLMVSPTVWYHGQTYRVSHAKHRDRITLFTDHQVECRVHFSSGNKYQASSILYLAKSLNNYGHQAQDCLMHLFNFFTTDAFNKVFNCMLFQSCYNQDLQFVLFPVAITNETDELVYKSTT